MPSRSISRREKIGPKSTKNKNNKATSYILQSSSPTLQELSGGRREAEEEERQEVSADFTRMADSSNGKLVEGSESVRDIGIDASAPAKKTHDENGLSSSSSGSSSDEEAEPVVYSGETDETKEEVSVPVVETVDTGAVSNHLDQDLEPPVEKLEGYGGADLESKEAAVEEEKVVLEVVSNLIEEKKELVAEAVEETTLPSLTEYGTGSGTVAVNETVVVSSDEKSEAPQAAVDVASKGIEETEIPISGEKIGEASAASYEAPDANVDDESLKTASEVAPVESAVAGGEYGAPEIPEATENPTTSATDDVEELLWTFRNSAPQQIMKPGICGRKPGICRRRDNEGCTDDPTTV